MPFCAPPRPGTPRIFPTPVSASCSDSPILKGVQVYHNFIKPHMGLNGKTPAEAAGIKVEGENKWLTLIQNATKTAKM